MDVTIEGPTRGVPPVATAHEVPAVPIAVHAPGTIASAAGEVHPPGASMRAKGGNGGGGVGTRGGSPPREHAGGMGAAVTEPAQAALNRMRRCVFCLALSLSLSLFPVALLSLTFCVCVVSACVRVSANASQVFHHLSLSARLC